MKIDKIMEEIKTGIEYINTTKQSYDSDMDASDNTYSNRFLFHIEELFERNDTSYCIEIKYSTYDNKNNIKDHITYTFECWFDNSGRVKMSRLKRDISQWLKFINRGRNGK